MRGVAGCGGRGGGRWSLGGGRGRARRWARRWGARMGDGEGGRRCWGWCWGRGSAGASARAGGGGRSSRSRGRGPGRRGGRAVSRRWGCWSRGWRLRCWGRLRPIARRRREECLRCRGALWPLLLARPRSPTAPSPARCRRCPSSRLRRARSALG